MLTSGKRNNRPMLPLWSSRWLTDETRLLYKIGGDWPVVEDPMSKDANPFSVNSERCAIGNGSSSWL
jgi:hypothetical protein